MLLKIEDASVHYGHIHALKGINLEVNEGETVALIGSNGAGKTTLLNAISGLVNIDRGNIVYQDNNITNSKPESIVKQGIIQCPEGRSIFNNLSVYENLMAGALMRKDSAKIKSDAEKYMQMFPLLKERRKQRASTLSGGEQQELAICRSLMGNPKILLLDEPSMGLAPTLVKQVFDTIKLLGEMGVTILLVEQNANMALKLSSRAYVIESGLIVTEGESSKLLESDDVRKAYLGDGNI